MAFFAVKIKDRLMPFIYRTSWRDWLLLLVLSLVIRLLTIWPIQQPTYMDAAYSYDIALNLARGEGFNEPFLWNYLDDPTGIPHPSHLYWMPLPTIMAWLGVTWLGHSYRAAQSPFVIMAALLPLVSYWVAIQITSSRWHAWLAGLLTFFSGFYVLYWGHTDNFTPFALAGSLSLVAAWQAGRLQGRKPDTRGRRMGARGWPLAAGVLAGLAHLSRADGPLLLVAIGLVWGAALLPYSPYRRAKEIGDWRTWVGSFFLATLGYLLVMLPWFARNYAVSGTLLPVVGARTMWLTSYDDLFSYGRELSPQSYLAWGWINILRSKLDALWLNIQTLVAVLGMVFLVPLALVGGWRLRHHALYRLAASYGLLLFLAMTFVFTFPGPRGGLFHSGGALLPFIFTASLVGLDDLVEWAASRRRGWDAYLAKRVFGIGLVGLALLVSGFLYYQRVVVDTRWRQGGAPYEHLVDWLAKQGQAQAVVMVGDPPGYWYYGGGPSVVVPNEPIEMLLVVAERYGARYLVLDRNRPAPLGPLYSGAITHPRLSLVATLPGDLRVYRIERPERNP